MRMICRLFVALAILLTAGQAVAQVKPSANDAPDKAEQLEAPTRSILSSEQLAQVRETTLRRREAFFSKESGKPLVRRPIKKNWHGRGDLTRHYAE